MKHSYFVNGKRITAIDNEIDGLVVFMFHRLSYLGDSVEVVS